MTPPSKQDELRDQGHSYDGIQEYDNPMPRWWLYIFWVSLVWGLLYALNVIPGLGSGKGRIANYDAEMAAAQEKYGNPAAAVQAPTVDAILAVVQDPAQVEAGKKVFTTQCVACHRADGGGQIGPNLTDDYWIHGGKPDQIWSTIHNGVLDKGMPAWGLSLKPDDVLHVAGYVISIHGSNPKDPKAPQGNLEAPAQQ